MSLLLLLTSLLVSHPIHPLKMCVCDVKHDQSDQTLQLKFRFFWDDLEATLEKESGQSLDLRVPSAGNDKLLEAFVRKHFILGINGQQVALQYHKAEIQDVVLVMSWKSAPVARSGSYEITLKNDILLDVFPDQYNLVRFDFFGDGNLETMRFERAERYLAKRIVKR